MKILHNHRQFPSSLRSSVTIGNFDGLHLGHRRILEDLVKTATASGTCSVVMTFSPHPLQILNPGKAPKLIVPTEEKIAHIESLGVDYLLVVKFDEALSRLSGEAFIREILAGSLRVRYVFVGHNFVFGYQRSGNVALLEAMGREYGYTVCVIPPVEVRGSRVSSTWIRELIRSGRISRANRLLGRYYSLHGRVVSGQGLGKTVLFPTLNLAADNEILPGNGVYATVAVFDGQSYPAVTNVGTRPTVAGTSLSVETHLLDHQVQAAPATLELQFLHRLRDEQKFPSVDELKKQIARDVERARRFFRLLAKFRRH
ncbi:MAG: bifunctional riboflavin kinase/FAD synthetase [Acidobacteria bacterium]|nr:bifunctional riboflavin kinase/FAD synthetase [Acidobacteriota bacterium]MCI0723251.1 bifunctional riboflavin kinase/FAD synthetase [Acidobacteriota bacterium]